MAKKKKKNIHSKLPFNEIDGFQNLTIAASRDIIKIGAVEGNSPEVVNVICQQYERIIEEKDERIKYLEKTVKYLTGDDKSFKC